MSRYILLKEQETEKQTEGKSTRKLNRKKCTKYQCLKAIILPKVGYTHLAIYFGSYLSRYLTFHTMTSVGRKNCLQ